MCGLLAYIGKTNQKKFLQGLDLIKHRGPDHTGYQTFENIYFGHQRLKVIDLSDNANQPMTSSCGRYVCIYNGEIYNYKNIKTNLIKKNIKFYTKSDTEVLINAYKYWKDKCLNYFEGMFAFVIYDKKTRKVFAARDRSGIKPLFFYYKNNTFCISSEVLPIIKLIDSYTLNKKSISSYLSYRYVINNETFFNEINEVPAGNYLIFSNKKIFIKKYWNINNYQKSQRLNEKVSINKLKTLITSSVKKHLESDIPVSAYLSGGLDSSIMVYEMSKLTLKKINTFCVHFEGGDTEDLNYSRQLSKKLKTNHNEIYISKKDYNNKLDEFNNTSSYPLGVPNEIGINVSSDHIKNLGSVIITGEGADELFGGYGRIFQAPHDYQLLKNFKNLNNNLKSKLFTKYGNKKFKNELDHFLYLYDYCPYKKNFLDKKFNFNHKNVFQNTFDSKTSTSDYFDKIQKTFIKIHLPGLLKRVDINTMSSGLEARLPFLDNDIVEFALRLNNNLKIKLKDRNIVQSLVSSEISETHDIPKFILKKLYEKRLSKDLTYRKKKGFPVPLDKWFFSEKDFKIQKIITGNLYKSGILSRSIKDNIKKLQRNDYSSQLILRLFSLEKFYSNFF
jgi:asparagine synthase (glutamine-hydrolysing)